MLLAEEHWSPTGSITLTNAFGPFVASEEVALPNNVVWIRPEQQVFRILADKFSEIAQVASICALLDSDGFQVWTFLNRRDGEARDKVYAKELEICSQMGVHDFDFRVTSIDLVSPKELVQTGFTEIFRR